MTAEYASLYIKVWEKLGELVRGVEGIKHVELGEKFPPKHKNMAFVCLIPSPFAPLSVDKSLFRLRYEIGVVTELQDMTQGMKRVVELCWKIREKILSDRTLDGLVENTEVLSLEPHWRGYRGVTLHWCGVVVECIARVEK